MGKEERGEKWPQHALQKKMYGRQWELKRQRRWA